MIEPGTALDLWLGVMVAVIAVNVLVTWHVFRASRSEAVAGTRTAADAVEDDVVACPDCGAANELGYRFCRNCVGELPGADGRVTAVGPSRSGSAF